MWEITEEIGHFLMRPEITREDRDQLSSIANHYKKLEWLATRTLMAELLASKGVEYAGISKDKWGKPHLVAENGEISVTHSFPYVSVIYHEQDRVGIDLEKPRSKIIRIAKKFLNDAEMADSGTDINKITLLWSAKEALYKLHGRKFVVFKENLAITPFTMTKKGILEASILLDRQENVKLAYEWYENFVVTYSVS